MSNNKQSSVEWQFEQLSNSFETLKNTRLSFDEYFERNLEIRKQAKAMHKEEIKEAHEQGQSDEKDYWNIGDKVGVRFMVKSEEYYNETFNTINNNK